MTNDQIKERIRKVLALAQQGGGGEMETAKIQLAAMLEKYGLRLEDIASDKRETCHFKYKNVDERRLLIAILFNTFGSDAEFIQHATYCAANKTVRVDLTQVEKIDIANTFEYYRKVFASERRAMLKSLFPAFMNKYSLFDIAEREDEQPAGELSPDELLRIPTIMRGMESPSYRKQLTE